MNSLLQAPLNCLHFLAATVQTWFAGEQLFVSITRSLGRGKWKKKSKELIPLVPCCVGGDAVKDKGSIPDVTWVPHILSLPLGWLCYMSPKLGQETSPASPSLLHPGFLPPHSSPSPDYAEGPSCTHNISTRDSFSPADFSWALLVSLKTLFCSHHLSQPVSCASSA